MDEYSNEDEGVLEPADSLLTDDLSADPLDTGIVTADKWIEGERGDSLDAYLAEEEPDEAASVVDDRWSGGPRPRSGRLLAAEGNDIFGADVGIDGGAASAEEAAMHIIEHPR